MKSFHAGIVIRPAIMAALLLGIVEVSSAQNAGAVIINEIVTDPQQDWNDSLGGNGTPFDDMPGVGTITGTDEWLELFNHSGRNINLTESNGWALIFSDTSPAILNFKTDSGPTFRFSRNGSLTNFQSCEYLLIGNPPGDMNNTILIELRDGSSNLVDYVQLGSGGAPDGDATSVTNESVARWPANRDTDNDSADFIHQASTIARFNGGPATPIFLSPTISGNILHFGIHTQTNSACYSMEQSTNLEDVVWQPVINFIAVNIQTNLSIPLTNLLERAFYRLRLLD